MYDKRAKQDALDLWFSMSGEMSVDDFAAELGYPSGSTLRNWIKADPRHDPDKCQYRSKPVLPKLEAIRRVAEGATAAQAARETGLTPQQVRYSVGRYARGGTAALLPAPARKRRKGEAVDEGKTRRASRPARPMPCEQPPGLPEELPDDPAALKAIIADLELSNAALREVLAVLKAGAPALTNAEAAGCASRLEGAFGAAAACAALGLARSTYYYQLDALTSPSAPPDGTAGEVERAFRVDGNSSRGYRFVREVVSRRRGRPVSEKVVRRLMRGLGLRVCYARRGRYSSYAGEIDAPAPNLLLRADGTHDFSAGRPNEAWVSDVTEFRLPDDGRKVYLSPVVDLFDGKPVGWAVGTSPDARLTESSLEMACATLGEGEAPVAHTDRGCHYRWPGWKAICGRHGLARSMSRKGTSPDNAACEGFFGNLKNEFFHGRDWSGWTAEAFMELLDGWMAAYSTVRLKAFREGGRTVYDTIDNRRRRFVSATAKSAERATLSRRRRPRFPAGGATALWPPALPRAAAQGALDRGVVEVRGPDLNLQRRGALGVPGRDRPARDLPSAELREPDRHRDVLCAERGQPPRGVRGPHDCPLSGSPSPSAASASRSFMR